MKTNVDRELLELAAKAEGTIFLMDEWKKEYAHFETKEGFGWNPLTDDGDALRLAVVLDFRIDIDRERAWAAVMAPRHHGIDAVLQTDDYGDPYAATRRAIVRAAAEIGKASYEKASS